ncbi:hypothetical protein I5L01_05735 [Erythrobacter sp. YJ-T3-07]|uniref:hypothetical protein n=1 Tax=Erythrobacter sp. YJ-T3-07 TaxID=2793063 RepID=UPI0018D29085|nr:hypothetical protein [Erythrobacter sp. YJ-T3-07]MBH1943733.1 hypothetical protein [Erythrobacter sp. YJ-T3-07]
MAEDDFLASIDDVRKIITPIDSTIKFPEVLEKLIKKYSDAVKEFQSIVRNSRTSEEIFISIRSNRYSSEERMALLKIFRRCVAPVLDTETSKKIRANPTSELIENFGSSFKPIGKLKNQFANLSREEEMALIALIGEYDTRGQSGYELTGIFFDWFAEALGGEFTIEGPRGAGRDIELSDLYPEFVGDFPCDFVIRRRSDAEILAVGFARYDATRGGAQSDDRTGGNANKVEKAKAFDGFTNTKLKMIFLADGPGLAHGDTWRETLSLDGQWNGRVRVTTLKIADRRITSDWLCS